MNTEDSQPAAWMWQTVESETRVSLSEPADCEEVYRLQPLFGNGELAAAVATERERWRELAEHLRHCRDCGEEDVARCYSGAALWKAATGNDPGAVRAKLPAAGSSNINARCGGST